MQIFNKRFEAEIASQAVVPLTDHEMKPSRSGHGLLRAGAGLFAIVCLAVASVPAEAAGTKTASLPSAEKATREAELAPLQMMVSLKAQKIDVYRGTELLSSSPISSGQNGHRTPTGVFSILEKRRRHFSNIYNNAPMPYMQRLTWSGIALHQGRLPGYPASHGCIRMPKAFAMDLFGLTQRGMHVVVTQDQVAPRVIHHPILPQPGGLTREVASLSAATIAADPALRGTLLPEGADTELSAGATPNPDFDLPLRMIVTPLKPENKTQTLQRLLNQMGFNAGYVDGVAGKRTRAAISLYQEGADLPVTGQITDSLVKSVYAAAGFEKPKNAMLRIRRKFKDLYEAEVTLRDPEKAIGTHVFTALGFQEGDRSVEWMTVPAEGETLASADEVLSRLDIDDTVSRDLARMLTPGSSLIVTDRSFARNTGLGTDFVVVTR
ncbi:L,D-transpeptidase family protein [Roseibium limicola]|nr:L,D-transpeptidase family protein [Roseibium limicola]